MKKKKAKQVKNKVRIKKNPEKKEKKTKKISVFNKYNKEKKEVLVIVAHPDDETIWMGGTLLQIKDKQDSNVTLICLCRKTDKDRYPKFQKACEVLGVKGYIFDLDDGEDSGIYKNISIQDIINKISPITNNKLYTTLYTHNENGEYGHPRHIETHYAVLEMLSRGLILAEEIYFFSYKKMKNKYQGYAIYNSSADKLIRLKKSYLKMKKRIIQEIYGYKKGGFEEKSCKEIEAFDLRK